MARKLGTTHGPRHRDPATGRVSGGNPGNRGGGRIPNAFRAECERLSRELALPIVARFLEAGPTLGTSARQDATLRWAIEWVTAYAHGKPTQFVAAPDDGEPVTFRVELAHPD